MRHIQLWLLVHKMIFLFGEALLLLKLIACRTTDTYPDALFGCTLHLHGFICWFDVQWPCVAWYLYGYRIYNRNLVTSLLHRTITRPWVCASVSFRHFDDVMLDVRNESFHAQRTVIARDVDVDDGGSDVDGRAVVTGRGTPDVPFSVWGSDLKSPIPR